MGRGRSAGAARLAVAMVLAAALPARGGAEPPRNEAPAGLRVVKWTLHDRTNDLLTGGVGVPALADPASALPTYVDPAKPTAAELRRAAIARRFDASSGEGALWGTGFDPVGQRPVTGDGKVTGREVLAFNDDGTGTKNVAMFVDVPDGFDVNDPCVLVVAPTSASRLHNDTYLASWGLRHNCAVASSDKGGGNGVHDLASDKVVLVDGLVVDADAAGMDSHYTSALRGNTRTDFLARYPNRISAKYYGGRNRMAEQGDDMVAAAKFALYVLNEIHGDARPDGSRSVRFTRENTTTILTGRSSGGGGAIKGAEADTEGYFHGVVVFEPATNPRSDPAVSVRRGGRTYRSTGQSINDYLAMIAIYMPCAGRADPAWPGYAALANGDGLCASLREKGLVAGGTVAEQARDAARILVEYGFDPDSPWQFPTNGAADPLPPMHAIANAYMRTGVERVLCGLTVALTVDAQGRASRPSEVQLAQMWVNTGTYAPQLIYEDSVGGPVAFTRGVSPSTRRGDYSLDAKLCMQALKAADTPDAQRYRAGELAAANTGNLHGKPTIIMHGREDSRVPATLTSRMYYGLNALVEGGSSKLRYIEVTNVAHVGGTPSRLVPQAYYLYHGLDWMWDHLRNGRPLPASQVVRTTPRGTNPDGSVAAITLDKLPLPAQVPAPADAITREGGAVVIPD